MPDTAITDAALLENAEQKAVRLRLSSFLVWNVNEAVLYVQDASGRFAYSKSWAATSVMRRADVAANRAVWTALLSQILDDVNDLLDYGTVSGSRLDAAIGDTLFVDYLNLYAPSMAGVIEQAARSDALLSAELKVWWAANQVEYAGSTVYQTAARINLINWINKFLFAHYLKRFHNAAKAVETIQAGTTVAVALSLFEAISTSCDFRNVFVNTLGEEHLDAASWSGLIALNALLVDFKLDSISQSGFHQVIDNALNSSRKKLAGQYATPRPLADLLVRLAIRDRTQPVLDPCCGTGTIARAAYELKKSVGVSVPDALSATWASDRFAAPLQLCSIALSDPLGMGEVVQVFKQDAFDLSPGLTLLFIEPDNGSVVRRALPLMQTVVSNLPFVRFEENYKTDPLLDGRADLYAGLILHLKELVVEKGQIGVITSNSWLGTDWGAEFRRLLFEAFKVKQVVISGEGRWFNNAKVVTTILILEKREATLPPALNEETAFFSTTQRLETWEAQPGGIDDLSSHMLARSGSHSGFTKNVYNRKQIAAFESVGIGWSASFTDLSWVNVIASLLAPVHSLFEIKRGERRGWDKLFYPKAAHGIEAQYMQSVLLSSKDILSLTAVADGQAFCCSDSLADLRKNGKTGAVGWIERFENATNGKGILLPLKLAKSGCYWYEMKPDALADLVVSINPYERLCVHRLMQRSFVNQRLIRLTTKPGVPVDVELCHALMNSVVGMFLIEAIGFGRGDGVLDLNATKLQTQWHLLNPVRVSPSDKASILAAFRPLLNRDILRLPDELLSQDRIHFDSTVLKAYGVPPSIQSVIYASLLRLFHIRQTART